MSHFRRPVSICLLCLFLACALTLIPLVTTYSQKKSDSESTGQEKRSGQKKDTDEEFADQDENEAKRRKDPCRRLSELPDTARKFEKQIKKRCRSGSSSGISKADFNGDGFADLAVGIPLEDAPVNVADSGAVIVIYGSSGGLTTTTAGIPPAQFWSQNTFGVPGTSEAGDNFGAALAGGDFNGDRFSDLAIGVPGEGGASGGVVVIYGSANGLKTADPNAPVAQPFNASTEYPPGFLGGERIGASLAWGDFDGDGIGDLAIGAPGAFNPPGFLNDPFNGDFSGAVWVLRGTSPSGTPGGGPLPHGGLVTSNSNYISMSDFGFHPQFRAEFGDSLAAGDFNGDGATDLAIGIPSQDFGLPGDDEDAGEVGVIFATPGVGLSTSSSSNTQLLTEVQFVASIGGPATIARPAPHNFFGDSLAAGDFNGDGRDDLAIGTPNEDFSTSATDVGAVFVAYSSRRQLNITLKQGWNRNSLFGAGSVEDSDGFGFSLATGDFDSDGRDDLAVGVPFRDFHSIQNGNVVTIVNAGGGLSINNQFWTAGSATGIPNVNQQGANFGQAMY